MLQIHFTTARSCFEDKPASTVAAIVRKIADDIEAGLGLGGAPVTDPTGYKIGAWSLSIAPVHALDDEEPDRFRLTYEHCGESWQDTSASMNNDHCPRCDREIEPCAVEDLEEQEE